MRIMEEDKVEVEEGDLVCFRTGYDRVILGMNKTPDAGSARRQPGRRARRSRRAVAELDHQIGRRRADLRQPRGRAASPSRPCEGEDHCASLPLHAHCLFKLGVYLGEIWHLSELADWLRANGRSRFLLTAPPLRLPGAVGSPANADRDGVAIRRQLSTAIATGGRKSRAHRQRLVQLAVEKALEQRLVLLSRSLQHRQHALGHRRNRSGVPICALPAAPWSSNCRPCRRRP